MAECTVAINEYITVQNLSLCVNCRIISVHMCKNYLFFCHVVDCAYYLTRVYAFGVNGHYL